MKPATTRGFLNLSAMEEILTSYGLVLLKLSTFYTMNLVVESVGNS